MTIEQLEAKILNHLKRGGLQHSSGMLILDENALHQILGLAWEAGKLAGGYEISHCIEEALAGK